MRMLVLTAALLGSPAMAQDICHDLWFTRNLVMDRAGYCFGSVLGKAQFDNADCVGKQVSLSSRDRSMVAEIRAHEKDLNCKVDVSRPVLDLPDVDVRRRLTDLPVRDQFESACIGWKLDDLPLRAGADRGQTVVGIVTRGDSVSFRHVNIGDWNYVTVTGKDWVYKSSGWTNAPFGVEDCEQFAG